MAVISGHEPRGPLRSGRYAIRSRRTATVVETSHGDVSSIPMAIAEELVRFRKPDWASARATKKAVMAPEHEDVAVGEVDHEQHAVDERVAEGDQGVDRPLREPEHDQVQPLPRCQRCLGFGEREEHANRHEREDSQAKSQGQDVDHGQPPTLSHVPSSALFRLFPPVMR